MSPAGATQMLSTPSFGASQDSQHPSGEIWPCARVGLPNSRVRGMSVAVMLVSYSYKGMSQQGGSTMLALRQRSGRRWRSWHEARIRPILRWLLSSLMTAAAPAGAFDLQGHRGARGLAPENTLAAFAKALEIGVTTLETDLAVTSDGVLVLSHDPVLNPDIVRGPDGKWLSAPGPAINSLTLAELKRFDIGRLDPSSKYARRSPTRSRRTGSASRRWPSCSSWSSSPASPCASISRPSCRPTRRRMSPDADTFARLAVEAIREAGLGRRATIQSFDWRSLLAAKKLAPEIETVCLTYDKTLQDRSEGGAPSPVALARRPRPRRARRLRPAPGGSRGVRNLVAPPFAS